MNGDGVMDLVTGCFEGGVYVLDGKADGSFAEPRPVLDKEGAWLRLGQYWDQDKSEWTEVATSHFAKEHGISAVPVDWDHDGDFDLLIGASSGAMYLRFNEGTATKEEFAVHSVQVQVAGRDLMVPGGGAMVEVADWDQDGRWDVLAGGADGAVVWFRNAGEDGAPMLEAPVTLVESMPEGQAQIVTGEPTRPGSRLQVDVGDWNDDGVVDLLVGDYAMLEAPARELTPAEQEELVTLREDRDRLLGELSEVQSAWDGEGDYQEFLDANPKAAEVMEQYRAVADRVSELVPRPTMHGWVWLYMRRVAAPSS